MALRPLAGLSGGLGGSSVGLTLQPPPTPGSTARGGGDRGNPRSSVGGASLANLGKGTENQDTFITGTSPSGSKCFVGVFDGHGERGGRISHFARDVLSRSLFDHEDLHSDPRTALEDAYRQAQKQIESRVGPEAAESGTTAVAAYQHRDRLFVANVGDSRAVLGRCDTSRGGMSAVDLSLDHKPSRTDERQRIIAAGGRVDQGCFPVGVGPGGSIRWMKAGPERVMDRRGMGGLAVSRSLGDLSLRPFVSSKPEVTERKLDQRDKLLVLGSDGIWDQLSSKEAIEIAAKHQDPNAAAMEITSAARKRWQAQTGGQMQDDITAVVVRLDRPFAASRPGSPGSISPQAMRGNPGRMPSVRSQREDEPRRPMTQTPLSRSASDAALFGRRGQRPVTTGRAPGGHR